MIKIIAVISIFAKRISNKVEFYITDNGPGIPNEEYERIFGTFYQVEKIFYRADLRELGLGLAIVKRLIKRTGGEIRVESKFRARCNFYFLRFLPSETYSV